MQEDNSSVVTPQHIVDMPFQRRGCRIYFGPVTKTVYSKGQRLPVEPLQGRTPEKLADIVADLDTEVFDLARFAIDGKASWASDPVPRVGRSATTCFNQLNMPSLSPPG